KLKEPIIKQVISLLEEGNTVPFIARYRKEATGGLDEVAIKNIQDTWNYAVQLAERKEEVIRLIDEQGKLTEDLQKEIERAAKLQKVEDLYRPYRQKRRTRATIAKEKGLEPLAEKVWDQTIQHIDEEAAKYFSDEHSLDTIEGVLAGVNDIIAEWVSDEPSIGEYNREFTWKQGVLQTEIKDDKNDEKEIYKMYYDYEETIRTLVSHRILAINRGEKEDVLRVSIQSPADKIITYLHKSVIKKEKSQSCIQILQDAIEDSYKRLIQPSVEREMRNRLTETAEEQAITVFSENLRNLLLQPPLKGRTVLGIDPAFRTGCKIAVVDETGKMIEINVIYPTATKNDVAGAEKIVLQALRKYNIELIAIGNGTASRETEQFVANVIQNN